MWKGKVKGSWLDTANQFKELNLLKRPGKGKFLQLRHWCKYLECDNVYVTFLTIAVMFTNTRCTLLFISVWRFRWDSDILPSQHYICNFVWYSCLTRQGSLRLCTCTTSETVDRGGVYPTWFQHKKVFPESRNLWEMFSTYPFCFISLPFFLLLLLPLFLPFTVTVPLPLCLLLPSSLSFLTLSCFLV